jgi:Fic family protein
MRAPLQVITGLHTLVAKEFLNEDRLARPRQSQEADDPLHIGSLPDYGEIPGALMLLSQQCSTTKVPAVIEAGYVHGEIMRLRPFDWGSGLVARATVRTVLSARSLDPSNFSIPENGMFESNRNAYVTAIRDFATGTQEGIEAYYAWFSASLGLGARAAG